MSTGGCYCDLDFNELLQINNFHFNSFMKNIFKCSEDSYFIYLDLQCAVMVKEQTCLFQLNKLLFLIFFRCSTLLIKNKNTTYQQLFQRPKVLISLQENPDEDDEYADLLATQATPTREFSFIKQSFYLCFLKI